MNQLWTKNIQFSLRHFALIAEILAKLEPGATKEEIVDELCDLFATDNPRFNEEVFRKASLYSQGEKEKQGTSSHIKQQE